MPPVKALRFDSFDSFGTMLDWRRSIARETVSIVQPRGFAFLWHAANNGDLR